MDINYCRDMTTQARPADIMKDFISSEGYSQPGNNRLELKTDGMAENYSIAPPMCRHPLNCSYPAPAPAPAPHVLHSQGGQVRQSRACPTYHNTFQTSN